MANTTMQLSKGVEHRYYLAMCLYIALVVVVGFWPTFYGPLLSGTLELPNSLKFHGVVFSSWGLVLVSQAWLASSGRIALHQNLGKFAAAYATFLVLVGFYTMHNKFLMKIATGDDFGAHSGWLIALVDMVLFIGFMAAAIFYRRKPQVHKRLIIVGTVAILGAAAGRMSFLPNIPLVIIVFMVPIIGGAIFDWITRGRPHLVYVIGLIVYPVSFIRVPLRESDAWVRFSRWLYSLLA
jgi:hypothetical protein